VAGRIRKIREGMSFEGKKKKRREEKKKKRRDQRLYQVPDNSSWRVSEKSQKRFKKKDLRTSVLPKLKEEKYKNGGTSLKTRKRKTFP